MGGVILVILDLQVGWLKLVEVFALCPVLFRLFRELSFGRLFLAYRLPRLSARGVGNLNVVTHVGRWMVVTVPALLSC